MSVSTSLRKGRRQLQGSHVFVSLQGIRYIMRHGVHVLLCAFERAQLSSLQMRFKIDLAMRRNGAGLSPQTRARVAVLVTDRHGLERVGHMKRV